MTAPADSETVDPVCAEFDAAFYLANNADVAASGIDPFEHFMRWGWREGRNPNRRFSVTSYLEVNPDVAAAGVNPFAHYVTTGRGEGRDIRFDLGFQFEILKSATPLEARIRALRTRFPDGDASSPDILVSALRHVHASSRVHVSISHDDFTANLGGVQLCLTREAKAMHQGGATHIHLYPEAPGLVIDVERERPLVGVLINGESAGVHSAETLIEILGQFAVGKAFTFAVHSFIGHNIIGVSTILSAMGAREGLFWIHDFSSVCAHYALLRNDVMFCGAPPPDSPACEVCLYERRRRIHLAEHCRFFQTFQITVLAPSQAALDLWLGSFPVSPAGTKVHPHAALRKRRKVATSQKTPGPLKVAFLGMPAEHKGWPVYAKLVDRFAEDPRYEFHHLGKRRDGAVEAHFTAIEPTPDITEPMAAAVETLAIDVAIIWSLCPETFCFTAYEAVAGGAVLLTNPDAGNVPRFTVEADCGRVIDDERALGELFESGEVLALARTVRGEHFYSLAYSRMSADFILDQVTP